jgi:hypothetical protein
MDLRTDRVAAAIELDKRWLDPRKLAPITKDQLRYFHPSLRSFSPQIPWQWVLGKRAVNLAIDNVFWFHSRQVRRRRCAFCSSNGVAAHFDPDATIRFATLWTYRPAPSMIKGLKEKDRMSFPLINALDFLSWRKTRIEILRQAIEKLCEEVITGKRLPNQKIERRMQVSKVWQDIAIRLHGKYSS